MTALQAHDIIREAMDAGRLTVAELADEQGGLLRREYQGTELRLALVLIDVSIAQRLQHGE